MPRALFRLSSPADCPGHERKNLMNLDKIVCNCMSVTSGMIKDAVDNGASTLEEVQEVTGAGTVCGACLGDVERLVEYFISHQDNP